MYFSNLDDPNALAELLASATPEQRLLQKAREWDDQTLAIEIAMIRQREKWTEWRERVLRMSDQELTQELKSLTADLEPHVEEYRSDLDRDSKQLQTFLKKLRHTKARKDVIREEQAFRNAEKVFTKRVQRLSDVELSEEMKALVKQLKKLSQDFDEGSNTEELRRRSKAIDRKLAVVKEEQVKRAEVHSFAKNKNKKVTLFNYNME